MNTSPTSHSVIEKRAERFRELSAERLLAVLNRLLLITSFIVFLISLITREPSRVVVTTSVLLCALLSFYQARRSNRLKSSSATTHLKLLLFALGVIFSAGTLLNGHVQAPAFVAFSIVLIPTLVWITTKPKLYGVLAFITLLGFVSIQLAERGVTSNLGPPSPYYQLSIYVIFAAFVITTLSELKSLLFESLGEVDRGQTLLEALFESSREGLLICHSDLSLYRVNAQGAELLETLHKAYGESKERALQGLKVTWETQELSLLELLETREGDLPSLTLPLGTRVFELTATPLTLDAQLEGYVITSRDVTELLSQRRRAQQAEKMDAIGHVTSNVAHDFNNHITSLKGALECISEHATPDQEEWLELMSLSAEQSSELVRQLLDFARDDPHSLQRVSLSATLAKATPLIKSAVNKSVRLTIEGCGREAQAEAQAHAQDKERGHTSPASHPIERGLILINPNALINVLVNLSVNASHAMPQGGELKFKCEATSDTDHLERLRGLGLTGSNYARLSVEDTGTGIAPEHLELIFEPFFTTKSEGEGTGLGLASAYQLMRRSGGLITVESEVGVGTRFELYFPLQASGMTDFKKLVKPGISHSSP